MRIVIQRVSHASVTIEGHCKSSIGKGMLILVGIEESDGQEDIDWLCKKIVNLRIFDDENGVMNKSILEDGGEILVISQFTLHASTKKGNRPSYIKAAKPDISIPLYEQFCKDLSGANKSITDASKQKLANSATTKSGVIFLDATTYSIRFRRFLCSSITPFGFPVEPEV